MIAFLSVGLAAGLLSGVLIQKASEIRGRRRFPAPGKLYRIRGTRLHLLQSGTGLPPVVFESGIAASSVSWSYVQELVAQYTRAISYDRSGFGWSERSRELRSLRTIVEETAELLEAASIAPPYVLVGHSFGGLLIRAFAHKFPDRIAGLVFVDPVSIESWAECSTNDARRLARGVKLSKRGAWLARLGVVRLALAIAARGGKRSSGTIARLSAGRATDTLNRLVGEVRKLPQTSLPAIQSQWSSPKSFWSMADHLAALRPCAREASQMTISDKIPVTILSAATANARELRERELWIAGSRRGKHVIVEETSHWMHLEKPELVAEAVREIVEWARSNSG